MTVGQQVPTAGAASLHAEEVLTLLCCCCALGHLIIVATPSLWSSTKLHWVKLTQVHAAAPPLLALWGKQFLSKLTRLGSQKMEESWDARKTTGKFVLKFQASRTQQSSTEKSPRLSSSHRWDSPARHSQPKCCLGHGGVGRDVGTAAVWIQLLWSGTQNPSPDQHPSLSLLHKHAFEHLL